MENKPDYNTQRHKLNLPEYGRIVQNMVESIKEIPDRAQRSRQAAADFDLDIDSPYPVPEPAHFASRPDPVPIEKTPVRAAHYGRNIERIIDLIATLEESETKTRLIRALAVYMRQQYLIWNKDSVADETIFQDIEKLSGGKIVPPEGLQLARISEDATFARPRMGNPARQGQNRPYARRGRKFSKKK